MAAEQRPLDLAITTLETRNMGDHAARLQTAHQYVPGETVEELVRRVFPLLGSAYGRHDATDELVIRVPVAPPAGDDPWALAAGQVPPSDESIF